MSEVLDVGLFFGGRSVEHEVSVVTAMQVLAALPTDRYRGIPVYIAKSGAWYTGDGLRDIDGYRDIDALVRDATRVSLRPEPEGGNQLVEAGSQRRLLGSAARAVAQLDVALPLVHGSHGEDGTLQGLFELCDLAYVGCGVAGAAISMDKLLTKLVLRGARVPVLADIVIDRDRWAADSDAVFAEVEAEFGPPHYVKPLTLGSSIGVTRAATRDELRAAVDTALTYDTRCMVEASQEDIVEINCSVLGRGQDLQVSVCEQPVTSGTLTYSEKYLSKGGAKDAPVGMKGARRLIPAPLDGPLTQRIQDAAATAFHAIGAEGVARVDFLVRPETGWFVVNELNTVPGSLSFYLWEPAGVSFPELLTRLIDMAQQRHAEKLRTTYSIDSWLLRGHPS